MGPGTKTVRLRERERERERERLMELCKRRYFHERKLWAVEFISFGRVESGKMRIADCARNYSGL